MATAIAISGKRIRRSTLPGFGMTLGYALLYLTFLVLIPLSMLFVRAHEQSWHEFITTVTDGRVLAAFKLSFGASFAAAGVNVVFGTLCAWVLARYRFPGRRFVDGLIDLPFALPTAVAGISLTTLFGKLGWIGRYLEPRHIIVDYTPLGITIALIFVGLPFVVRTVQPVIEDMDRDVEEAAANLGAPRWQTVLRVVLPTLVPPAITGFALAFARGLGEYGSVVFIAGNIPYKTEIIPLLITSKLDENDYSGATAVAAVTLVASFLILLGINGLQAWTRRRQGEI